MTAGGGGRSERNVSASTGLRARLAHPLTPVIALGAAAPALALGPVESLTWAVLGGLAGYSLSGSV